MAQRPRRGSALRRIFGWTVFAGVLAVGIAGFVLWREITTDLPPVDQLLSYQPPEATRIFAEDGTLIGEFFVERRYVVPLSRLPDYVRNAFLAAEDAEFYRHPGVDPVSVARAFVRNLASKQVVQGGSTITQQVVKTLLLSPERSYQRKLKEMILALRLETKLSKDDILYLYVNQIYFGGGAYGVAAAARTYFDADVEDLTIAQAAMLAGLPQLPSFYDPQRHPKRAHARKRYVLDRMRQERFITEQQYLDALNETIIVQPRKPATYLAAPWYVEHVRRLLEERYGGTAAAQLGLRVYTAVDLSMQEAAEQALQEGLRDLDRRQGFRGPVRQLEPRKVDAYLAHEAALQSPDDPHRHAVVTAVRPSGLQVRTAWERGEIPASALVWGKRPLAPGSFKPGDVLVVTRTAESADGVARFVLDQDPQVQGAIVSFDTYTGQVKAMVGGYSFARSQFNRAVQARRQPGSAIKPLLYAAAMDHGFTPASVIVDAPLSFPGGNGRMWTPKNYGGKYYGPVTLRNALQRSLNTVTVRLVDQIGLDYARQYLDRFGFSKPAPRNLSLALGSHEVTPLELTRAYGVFATLGKRFEPIFITAVTDREGRPIDFGNTRPRFERVMSPQTAYIMTSMMESVIQNGTGRRAAELERPAAGKTGTTNDTHDAWFVGFTPELVTGVWIGFDSERSLGPKETGGVAAAPVWTNFMKAALQGRPVVDFPVPEGVTFAQIDPGTGLRAVSGSAQKLEVFVAGSEPTEFTHVPEPEPADPDAIVADPASATAPHPDDAAPSAADGGF
jgi:penicillin-binding protein 1A